MRLQDKVIVVTGATSGIGKGIARVLAGEGACIVLAGRNSTAGLKVEEQICRDGGNAFFVETDIRCVDMCRSLIDETVKKYGRIDGLVNNAGIFPYAEFEEVTEEMYDSVLETNIKGAFFCTQQAVKYMKQRRCGSVVNIGSTHWQTGGLGLSVYSVSKGGLHTFTQHISHHYAPDGIRCNWVTVGWVMSDGEKSRLLNTGMTEEDIAAQAKKEIPMGQFQTAEDIANACVYLLSDEAMQVTGTDIKVTGGFLSVSRIG